MKRAGLWLCSKARYHPPGQQPALAHLRHHPLHLPIQRACAVHNQIGIRGGGPHVGHARWPDSIFILIAYRFRRASALLDIALEPPLETQLLRRIDVNAQVIVRKQFGVIEREVAFDDEKRPGVDMLRAAPDARVGAEVVDRALDAFAARQCGNVLGEQRDLDQRRIVEVLLDALGQRYIRKIEVIVVEMKAQAAHQAGQLVGQRGLARAGTAANAHHRGRKRQLRRIAGSRGRSPCGSRLRFHLCGDPGRQPFEQPASRFSTMRPVSFTSSWLSGVAPSPAARLVTQLMPSTSIPMCRATSVSGTVDMPTSVAPRARKARISAGVSKLGPGVAR